MTQEAPLYVHCQLNRNVGVTRVVHLPVPDQQADDGQHDNECAPHGIPNRDPLVRYDNACPAIQFKIEVRTLLRSA
jgi:hypothetical protein